MQQTLIYVVWAGDQIEWSFPPMSVWRAGEDQGRHGGPAQPGLGSDWNFQAIYFNMWPDGALCREPGPATAGLDDLKITTK